MVTLIFLWGVSEYIWINILTYDPGGGCNSIYVRPLWRIIERKSGVSISVEQIVGVDPSFEYDEIATILSFLIYKEWLLSSLESKHRSANLDRMYYKSELQSRIDIYKLCRCIDQNHVDNLMEIMLLM